MTLHAALCAMKDRPFGERRFHVPEGMLGPGEQGIDSPGVICREVSAISLREVSAVEVLGGFIRAIASLP
jgi:hypothetical protein